MALTELDKLKLEIGLSHIESGEILTDEELQYFLDKNNGSIRRAGLDAAKTMLFILSQYVHERSGMELEIWGQSWYTNYLETLKLYISDPNYNIAMQQASPYAGGISKADIRSNLDNTDVKPVKVESKTPSDFSAEGHNDDIFEQGLVRLFPFST